MGKQYDSRSIYQRRESEVRSYCRNFPAEFTKAKNATIQSSDGREFIDFLSGCSALNYGHNDPEMIEALVEYIQGNGITHGLDMHTEAKSEFLETFERLILEPRDMDHRVMFPGPTGTNAVEAAMKIARKVTGRHTVMCFTNGFHGMTHGALAATGSHSKRAGAGIMLTGVQRLPYEGVFGPDIDTLKQIETYLNNPSSGFDAPAAFLIETVQGEGGLNATSKEWLQGIAQLAEAQGALLIIDDIQAGIGRTDGFFSFESFDIKPDIITLAKSLSGLGLPLAALLIRPEYDIWKPSEHNGTFRGNNHAFVTARVALEKYWSNDIFIDTVQDKAKYLDTRLNYIQNHFDYTSVKGRGMMKGIDIGCGELARSICNDCFRRGLIIETSGAHDEVIKVLAPLTIPQEQFTIGLNILEQVFKSIPVTENVDHDRNKTNGIFAEV